MSTSDAERRDEESIAEPFDQTNGMMPGSDGESDGTAASDTSSAGEREDGLRDTTDETLTEGDRGAATGAAMSVKRTG